MMIGGVEYELSDKDPIFAVSSPQNHEIAYIGKAICTICHDIIKKQRYIVWCQFCAKSHCRDCAFKEREFPRAFPDDQGHRLKGVCCKVCDRKFIMKDIQLQNAARAQTKFRQCEGMEQKIESITQDNIDLV